MSALITPEGVEVKVGQVWKDLDKRMNRHLLVLAFDGDTHVLVSLCSAEGQRFTARVTRVAIKRMRKNSTGYELVKDVA
jgi:hypothetical protein